MISAQDALEKLQAGNQRYVDGDYHHYELLSQARREEVVEAQHPFAIVLGCSDSRVPAELVFDQGIGDLFVIRVAGNIVAPSQVGSIEFAASQFGTPLVVVLGHSRCGAVDATLSELQQPTESRSPNLQSIVDRIRPAVQSLLSTNLKDDPEALMDEAIRANVRASVAQLKSSSRILEDLIQAGRLTVVGAEYSLESGKVTFFEHA